MTKKISHALVLCAVAAVAMLCGGCVSDGAYVGGAVYSDVGYAPPVYVERGPYYGPVYGETVVIERGYRRGGYYADGRRNYRTSHYDGRRYNSGSGYNRSTASRSSSRSPSGRGRQVQPQQTQVQTGRQNRPAAATRPQRGSVSEVRARIQEDQGR